jgi:MFS family permease
VKDRRPEKNKHKNKNISKPSSEPSSKISMSAWITLGILGSSLLITMYGETMLLPAIPDIIREFNITYNTSSWILTSYLIAGAVMTPIAGKLSDVYGRKKMILIIMSIYIAGIFLGGLSTNISILIISRVIQGIGVSMFPIAFGIIRDQFPQEKLAIGVGIFSSMFAAGSVVGLAVGASIIQNFGWRTTFFSIVPLAIILWFVIRRFINDIQYPIQFLEKDNGVAQVNNNGPNLKVSRTIDIKGAIALAVTITSFLIVLSYLETSNAIISIQTISFLVVGIISFILFVIIEKTSESPLIDFKLISNKIILPANILLLITFLTMFTVYQTIPVLVRSPSPSGLNGDAIATANIQLPFMIVFLVFAPSSGFIISKLGNVKPTTVGSIISIIGFFSLLIYHSTDLSVATTLAIIATGLSLTQVGGFNIILEHTPRQFSGISLGMTVLLNLIGGAIGPAIAGIVMQTNRIFIKGINGSFPSFQSYNMIFLTTALLSLVSVVLVLIIKNRIPNPKLVT